MKLFSATGLSEFVARVLLGQLKKSARRETFTLVIVSRLSEMTRCVLLRNTAAATVIAAF